MQLKYNTVWEALVIIPSGVKHRPPCFSEAMSVEHFDPFITWPVPVPEGSFLKT